jgi:hypothetical protein
VGVFLWVGACVCVIHHGAHRLSLHSAAAASPVGAAKRVRFPKNSSCMKTENSEALYIASGVSLLSRLFENRREHLYLEVVSHQPPLARYFEPHSSASFN